MAQEIGAQSAGTQVEASQVWEFVSAMLAQGG